MSTTPDGRNRPYCFLSYASPEREVALRVASALESAGIAVWIDRTGISAGTAWAGEIVAAIRQCGAMAVLCSRAAIASRNVRQELQLAWDNERPILPVILEPVEFPDALSYFLQGWQWIEATGRPEASWIADLSSAFSRLDTPATPHAPPLAPQKSSDLPVPSGPLVGRDREIEHLVGNLLGGSRLVTLTGPGGVGKTRLAMEAAHRVARSFSGGAIFIDLSSVTHSDHVPSTIAQALGIRESPDRSTRDALNLALRTRPLLLVLDNFEQVIDAAPVVAELVASTQNLIVLVTSREALRVRGEEVLTIDPLDLPTDQETADVEALSRSAAVRLFMQTARAAKPGFEMMASNALAIAEICRRLEGLPLAIELAASRVRYFPPDVLLDRLGARLPVLTGGSRDLPARHQTLRDTIAWSYDLLTPDEQALFRRIGAFPGGASLAALDTYGRVAGALELELLSGLASLVDKSLIRERLGADGTPRFSMLETLREFAGEMTAKHVELETQRKAIVASALEFVSPGKGSVLAWVLGPANLREIDDELDNVRAAFTIAADQGDAESCALVFTDMHGYLLVRGLYREAIMMGRRVLELADAAPISEVLRGRTLTDLAYFWSTLVDPAEGAQLASEGLALARSASDDEIHLISALDGPLTALRDQGQFAEALVYAEEADALASTLGNELIRGTTKFFLGNLSRLMDDRERAVTYLQEAMELSQGNEIGVYAGSDLVDVYLRQSQVMDAASTLQQVMRWWQEAGSGANGRPLDRAALLAVAGHRPEVAATLFGANAAQNAMLGMRDRDDRWTIEALEAARAQLGDEAFESASREGRALSLEAAIDIVMDLLDQIEAQRPNRPEASLSS
jgi:predicted ATPase